MKKAISFFLAATLACSCCLADTKAKTTRKSLDIERAIELVENSGDTIAYADKIILSGYDKTVTDINESFYVTNETPFHLSKLTVLFTYTTTNGDMLHEETYEIPCDIPTGETRLQTVRSFDRKHALYYYKSRKPKRSATPFLLTFKILSYDIRINLR